MLRSSLVLGAVSVWMLNALNFRLSSNLQFDTLADVCCQHIRYQEGEDNDEDCDDTTPLRYQHGLYFLADIMKDNRNVLWHVPISALEKVEEVYLIWFYGQASLAVLERSLSCPCDSCWNPVIPVESCRFWQNYFWQSPLPKLPFRGPFIPAE